jgi:O-phosphoseryl-tRNA(Cys) synthetase
MLEENHNGSRWWLRLQHHVNKLAAAQKNDIPCLDRVLYRDINEDHSVLLPYYCESPRQLQQALEIDTYMGTRAYSVSVHSQEYEYPGEQSYFDG